MAPLHEVFGDEIAAALGAPKGESSQNSTLRLDVKRKHSSPSGSTRASSPGCESATSDGPSAPSPGMSAHTCGSLAERRGLRAAILNDLGVGLESEGGSDSCNSSPEMPLNGGTATTPNSSANAVWMRPCLTATHPRPQQMCAVADVAHRRPPLPPAMHITGTQSPACQRNTPTINSMLTGSSLGSSPGSPCDASQRSPARTAVLATSSWGNAANCMEATRAAAAGNHASMVNSSPPLAPAPLSPPPTAPAPSLHMFPPAAPTRPILSSVPRSSYQQGYQPQSPMAQDASLPQPNMPSPSGFNSAGLGFGALSNEELAEQLREAAPEVYED